jgi:tight adherence protein C
MTTTVTLLVLLWFVGVMGLVAYLGYRYWIRPAAYLDRVGGRAIEPLPTFDDEEGGGPSGVVYVIRRLGRAMPASPEAAGRLRKRLIAAGYRSDYAVMTMRGIQMAAAFGAGLGGSVLLATLTDFGPQGVFLLSGLFALGGWFLPNEILGFLITRRRRTLRFALPDALDLMVVCVESGTGLDQALVDVAEELRLAHPELSEELALVNLELRAGTRRMDALRNMAQRTGEGEIKKLVALLIQTDRFGTSIAQALRTHSDFMRVRRRQAAEEKANKIGVKLVFPIFFLILPAMFLVTVGPALLSLIFEFFPSLRNTIR